MQIENPYLVSKDCLYHYTSTETLIKIVQTKTIWLSSLSCQNDKKELVLAIDSILPMLVDEPLESPFKSLCRKLAGRLVDIKTTPANIFSFSLTERGNLLSQWRGYTKGDMGVSIGFNTKNLSKRAAEHGIVLEQCSYDLLEHLSLAKDLISGFKRDYADQPEDAYAEARLQNILVELAKVKPTAFSEELEYRLISKYHARYAPSQIKYRASTKYLIPYIELDISGLNPDGTIFENVFVGPREYPNHDMTIIPQFLSGAGACNRVTNSEVPLRT